MKRKDFVKKSVAGVAAAIATKTVMGNSTSQQDNRTDDIVGFNHLPAPKDTNMNTVLHKANTRGNANHGWLNSYHSFSFANYYNPERMGFGKLRVLNDDYVKPGMGFNTHPHSNMEIISIPLEGDLEHQDSAGNVAVIKEGDIQVMSAGSGIYHSEFNKNKDKAVKFLQIWVLTNKIGVNPRYDQMTLDQSKLNNRFMQILSPNPKDDGVWIYQDAWFHLGKFSNKIIHNYKIHKKGNGLYAFILEGTASIENQKLGRQDAFGIWNTEQIKINADENSTILLLEVPMI